MQCSKIIKQSSDSKNKTDVIFRPLIDELTV